jgi:pheromone shutdown protein TraB
MITNDACLMRPTTVMQYWSLVSGSYFFYDLLVCVFLIRENTPIMYQTYFHHVLGVLGTVTSALCNNHILSICVRVTPPPLKTLDEHLPVRDFHYIH